MLTRIRALTKQLRPVPTIVGIAVGGWLLRLWAILVYRPTCDTGAVDCYTVAGDAFYHHGQANLLADHGGYYNPLIHLATEQRTGVGELIDSAGDPPLFAAYLASWSKIGFDGVTDHRVVASFWGFALVLAVGLFTRRLAGNVAGAFAALIAALHPLMWINDIMLLSESMYQPFVVLMFWAAYEWIREPSRRNVAILGVTIALATMIRAEALSLYGFMVLPLIWWGVKALDTKEKVRQTVLCGLAGLLLMSPWLVYNNLRFEKPVTISAVTGTVMMGGACDGAWTGLSLGYWVNCFDEELIAQLEEDLPGTWPETEDDRVYYDESVTDEWNREQAIEYYLDNWRRYPKVALARMGRSLELYRVSHTLQMQYRVEGRWEEPSTVGLGVYYTLIPFSVVGALLLRRRRIRLTPLLAMWPMIMFASAITFGLTRYRVPIDIAMIVLASVAMSWIFHRLRAEGVFRAVLR
ncbi:MAG: glycosyltransferase family 39 protein [Acidimicrobiales bacterium]|nr:glycosyltransferase family 39 protein [Acidimicrobiales bacterium]